MEESIFRSELMEWYQTSQRSLPWREAPNAYSCWLSEIILQQTRVAQGAPYYARFLETYPTVQDLADAPEEEVMRLWQGLGYYSRARNLHKCAKTVSHEMNNTFPSTYAGLQKLPGIGKYTAAAIASIVFNEAVPAVDGNMYRVFARYFGIQTDIASPKAFKEFFELGATIIDSGKPGDFNQAVMDLGATVCTPKKPLCDTCPLASGCHALAKGSQGDLPVKKKKIKVRERHLNYIVIRNGDKTFMRKREAGDVWQDLYDFHLIETEKPTDFDLLTDTVLESLIKTGASLADSSPTFKHVLSHQRLFARFYIIEAQGSGLDEILQNTGLKAYTDQEIESLAKPILIENYLKKYLDGRLLLA
ncbi:A/G-specific adenine glycosylase [Fulvitalea axinellae]|uniref:Adenine DNA glycosylase n=1 Tax=Fulvitalea axinellae TaxID=1182444 RepID=A0AAU9CVZ4_9BACT|nr:A/G-specific adenine glycosylase [Fulvitalea axinellae]